MWATRRPARRPADRAHRRRRSRRVRRTLPPPSRRHLPVRRAHVRLGHAAEDIVHEAFVAVMDSASRYRPGRSTAKLWLLGIARNHVRRGPRASGRCCRFPTRGEAGHRAADDRNRSGRRHRAPASSRSAAARLVIACRCAIAKPSCCAIFTSSVTRMRPRRSAARSARCVRVCIVDVRCWRANCAAGRPNSRARLPPVMPRISRTVMTCRQLTSRCDRFARGVRARAVARMRAVPDHLRSCASCAALVERERAMSRALRRLARERRPVPALNGEAGCRLLAASMYGRAPRSRRATGRR